MPVIDVEGIRHVIDHVRDGYVAVVRRLMRVAIVGVVVVAGVLAASAWLFSKTPQSFLPDEDQGAIFAALPLLLLCNRLG